MIWGLNMQNCNEALNELGILDGINEVIATTENCGRMNAAPLGIIRDGDNLYIRLFLGTHTYDNILANGWFVANISHDAWLFAETALEDLTSGILHASRWSARC